MARLSSIVFIICLLLCNNAISEDVVETPSGGDVSDGGVNVGDVGGGGSGSETLTDDSGKTVKKEQGNSDSDQVSDSTDGQDSDKIPKEPAPTTPKEPAPTTPKEPAPTTPKEPEPTTPKEPEPTTPKESEPTPPKGPAPSTDEGPTVITEQGSSTDQDLSTGDVSLPSAEGRKEDQKGDQKGDQKEDQKEKQKEEKKENQDPASLPSEDTTDEQTKKETEQESLPTSKGEPESLSEKPSGDPALKPTESELPSAPVKDSPPTPQDPPVQKPAEQPASPPAKEPESETPKVSQDATDLNRQKQEESNKRSKRSPQPQVPETKKVNDITDMESYLMKNYDGVKVIGLCGVYFRVQFSPHLLLYGLTKFSIIQIEPFFERVRIDFEHQHPIRNKCVPGKAFAFISYVKDNILTLKWKVFVPPADLFANDVVSKQILSSVSEEPSSPQVVDVRKYRLPQLDRPFTSIQVYKANTKEGILETKNYVLKNAIPEKCSKISMDCFLNGNVNIENCFKCKLLVQNAKPSDECFKYLPSDMKENLNDIKITAQSDEDNKEIDLIESIDILLSKFYKVDLKTKKLGLITIDDFDDVIKVELYNYCKLLKGLDTQKTLENVEMGDEMDVFNNLLRFLKTNEGETKLNLYKKLRNTAMCLKDVNTWAEKKRGLILPEETTEQFAEAQSEGFYEEDPDDKVNLLDLFDNDEDQDVVDKDGIIDMSLAIKHAKLKSPYFNSSKYCNYDYCDRWQDKTSCISNIDVEEQGNCSLCWLFASKLHLETIRCMRGFGHNRGSALYVANCSERKGEQVCNEGSNPLEFLKILEKNRFLPLESNYPYLWKNVSDTCPRPEEHWTNIWGNTKLLYNNMYGQFIKHRGYIVYNSRYFAKNMDVFIDIVKREIRNKGSVIAYIKTKDVIDYDFNGRYISNICGDSHPDHAVNIIGYGNYISDKGEKRTYWLIRNSWGYYWGHEGNFKVDVLGPDDCVHNFIHTAIVFKIDMEPDNHGGIKNKDQSIDENKKSYFPQLSSNFYHSLYYNNYEGHEAKSDDENDRDYDNADVSGESETSEDSSENGSENGSEESQSQSGGSENQVASPEAATSIPAPVNTPTPNIATIEKTIQILHILKHIENYKMTRGLVKYDNLNDTKHDYACARSSSNDPKKVNECKQFCEENWERCKKHYSPGYCLTALAGKSSCLFCYV
ncbi:serine repeat antigen 3, putative [Plasmodium chabaudi chabaudi]|uniref:Putative papain-like cysteine prorease n=1 Tax=Plasmodium chabaudi chabaudi TaxID=31271 RepID=A0A0E4B2E3_PLACU|nr:putative papain-like cysteine prorease [Plasmodium chabaudi chabaudi]SCL97494.1 serine repeat antigen 3, putative [Plasmodium chabaudi chabaudi]